MIWCNSCNKEVQTNKVYFSSCVECLGYDLIQIEGENNG